MFVVAGHDESGRVRQVQRRRKSEIRVRDQKIVRDTTYQSSQAMEEKRDEGEGSQKGQKSRKSRKDAEDLKGEKRAEKGENT